MKSMENLFYVGLISIIIVFGMGMYFTGAVSHESPSTAGATGEHSYNLTLVITNQNYMQSQNHMQPAYYVLQDGKLLSSAQIYIPANSIINLTIINYDYGPGTVPAQYSKVMGTLNGTEYVVNDTNVNMSASQRGQYVKSVPSADLAHTFTIPKLGLNIMVPSDSIVSAQFQTGGPGVYGWQCQVDCGTGPSGWNGAMATPGWMMGQVIIQ